MSAAVTPWLDGVPSIIGVYERELQNLTRTYQHWNGKYWGMWSHSITEANNYRKMRSTYQNGYRFRGLEENPQVSRGRT